MKKSQDYIFEYEQDLIDKDEERDELFDYIDKMARIDWDFSPAIRAARPDIRTIRDSTPAAAVENASIALSNQRPAWNVPPYSNHMEDYIRANKLEYMLDCQFAKSNVRGTGTVLFDKARSSILYNMIATRTDDLATILPKNRKSWTNLQREAWAGGRFIQRVYKPKTVHVELSDMGKVAVVQCEVLRAMDVYNYWLLYADDTDEGRQVQEALRKMRVYLDDQKGKGVSSRKIWFAQYYYIDHDQILRHGHFTPDQYDMDTNADEKNNEDDIVFADAENDAGFINWSIRVGGTRIEDNPKYSINPMLAGLYYSNVWETTNIIRSIVLSKPIAELERPTEIQYTLDGQRLPEADGVALGKQGDRVERPGYPQIDPMTMQVVNLLEQSIVRDTGASALGDISNAKGTAFSALNAVIQIVMSRLDGQRRDMGLSLSDDALNALKWVEHNKVPLLAYRQSNNTVAGMQMSAGEQMAITADDFDAYEMELYCEVKPKTPTDRQQQILSAIQLHDKAPLPWAELLQDLGFKNTELLKQQRIMEDFEDAKVQAAVQSIMAKQQMQDQMEAQQAQQQAQAPQGQPPLGGGEPPTGMPNPGGGLSETAFGGLGDTGMQGMNPAGGGMPPAMSQPGLTREAVSGMSRAGQSTGG